MKFYIIFFIIFCSLLDGNCQDTYSVESPTKGLSVTANFGRIGWSSDDFDAHYENGFYYGVHAGYGINHQWSIFLQTHFASIVSVFPDLDNYSYFEINLGPRYYFGSNTKKWRPFVGAHLNYTKHSEPIGNLDFPGTYINLRFVAYGMGLSAGIHYYFTPQISAFGLLQGTYGKSSKIYLDDILQDQNYTFTSVSYGIGISYLFSD